jgi:TRAP-type C4-dicarboxylate transport system permease large subunit
MFPIAKKLGIHDIHYSMIVVAAMNIGYMTPPIGIGLYIACRIGDASPPSSTPNPDFSRFRPPDLNKIKHLQLMS